MPSNYSMDTQNVIVENHSRSDFWLMYIVNLMLTPGSEGRFHSAWTAGTNGGHSEPLAWSKPAGALVFFATDSLQTQGKQMRFQRPIHLIYKPKTF